MEYRVHKAAASQAEIKLDIESAGHWFGGGAPCDTPHALTLTDHHHMHLPDDHRCVAQVECRCCPLCCLCFMANHLAHTCRASDAAAVAIEQSFPGDRAFLPL